MPTGNNTLRSSQGPRLRFARDMEPAELEYVRANWESYQVSKQSWANAPGVHGVEAAWTGAVAVLSALVVLAANGLRRMNTVKGWAAEAAFTMVMLLVVLGTRAARPVVVVGIVLLVFPSGVEAVKCTHCGDSFDPSGHAPDACPLITTVTTNAAAIVGGAVAIKGLSDILPDYVARLFPTAAIRSLVTLLANPSPGAEYKFTKADGTDKDLGLLIDDFQNGLFTKDEAIKHFAKSLGVADKRDLAKDCIDTFKALTGGPSLATSGEIQGAYRYVFARVSEYVMVSRNSGAAWLTVSQEVKDAAVSATSLKAPTHHPKAAAQFFEMLNLWIMVVHSTGMASAVIVTTFLQRVVYHPMAEEDMEWHQAYCLFFAYLIEVEREKGCELSNIHARGGADRLKTAAMRLHREYFGTLFDGRDQGARGPGGKSASEITYNGKFNRESKIPCKFWNLQQRHDPASLNADGSCNFLHRCNAFLKPLDGQSVRRRCLGEHVGGRDGAKCTNPDKLCKPCE